MWPIIQIPCHLNTSFNVVLLKFGFHANFENAEPNFGQVWVQDWFGPANSKYICSQKSPKDLLDNNTS
jgi:hypothetical protein